METELVIDTNTTYRKMDPRVKAMWVEALRSGKYQQGRRVLRNKSRNHGVRHCCLGVLCEMAIKDGVKLSVTNRDNFGNTIYEGHSIATPPLKVRDWAGGEGAEIDGLTISTLMNLNDNAGYDFNAIAAWIEKNL